MKNGKRTIMNLRIQELPIVQGSKTIKRELKHLLSWILLWSKKITSTKKSSATQWYTDGSKTKKGGPLIGSEPYSGLGKHINKDEIRTNPELRQLNSSLVIQIKLEPRQSSRWKRKVHAPSRDFLLWNTYFQIKSNKYS